MTSGRNILAEIDGRSAQARRFRDLCGLLIGDLGGEKAGLGTGQLLLVRRTAALTVELERLESQFAQNGGADRGQLESFQRATNTLRRLLESLGIARGRIPRDVTAPSLHEYLASRDGKTIDHEQMEGGR